MAPKKQPFKKLGPTARYYRENPKARIVKAKKDTEINKRPKQIKKRNELAKARRKYKKKGVNLKGKDIAHTSSGLRLKSIKANRGSKSDSPGDRRARGKKKK